MMTTEDKTYSGWTNYETWNLALWIDNEAGSYEYWRETAREIYESTNEEHADTRKENAALELADRLKSDIEENKPEVSGFYADVLQAAIDEVNYYEIAKNWIDEASEGAE